jgi:hypothetical protein
MLKNTLGSKTIHQRQHPFLVVLLVKMEIVS